MKSGKSWGRLGMKSEWKTVTINDCADVVGDGLHGTPKSSSDGAYAFVNGNNLTNGKVVIKPDTKRVNFSEFEKYKKPLNDRTLLVSINGTLGNIAVYNGEKIILGKSACYINVKTKYDRDFIFYTLSSPTFRNYMETNATGTTIKNFSLKQMREYSFSLPDIAIQKRISSILTDIDNKIATNIEINDNLEEQSKVIFDKLFPNISNGSYTVGNYITPKRGKNLLSKNAVQGNVPVVAGGLVPSVYHNTSNTKAPVLAISASGANAGYVSLWNIPIWASDSSYIDSSMTNNVYFWYVLLKKRQKEIFDAQTGSAQPHIYPQHIAGMPIKELEVAKIQEFNAMVTPIFEKIGKNLKENTQLKTLRDILLPKLMSGEIDISAVQF